MNFVPAKRNSSHKHFDAALPDAAEGEIAPRPPLRVLQEQRANDAAQAVREYEANQRAVEAKSERLRALRIAKAQTTNASSQSVTARLRS